MANNADRNGDAASLFALSTGQRSDLLLDARGHLAGPFAIRIREGDDKFLAAEAGNNVCAPRTIRQYAGYPSQYAVAFQMSITVVDGLEIIDVDHKQGHFVAAARAVFDEGVELADKIAPVMHAREPV